jgi:signal transduction histidine kinase
MTLKEAVLMSKYLFNEKNLLGAGLAFIFTVGTSYVNILIDPEFAWTHKLMLIAVGLVYIVFGMEAISPLCRTRFGKFTYFSLIVFMGSFIVWQSRYNAFLVMMPIPALAAFVLQSRWGKVVVYLFVIFGEITAYALNFGWPGVRGNLTMIVSAVAFVAAFAHVAAKEMESRTKAQQLTVDLSEANQKLRSYAFQVEELAAEKERNRISRELHDSLGHYLTAIHMQINAAQAVLAQDPKRAMDAMGKVQTLAGEGLSEVRRAVAALRVTPLAGKSLINVLEELVESSCEIGLFTVFELKGAPRRLEPQLELAIYRVVQEGLTNIRKHAQADKAWIVLDYEAPNTLKVLVRDNGKGAQNKAGEGFGLLGLRERLHLCGGQLKISSDSGKGFTLEAEVPG